MRRLLVTLPVATLFIGLGLAPAVSAGTSHVKKPECADNAAICAEVYKSIGYQNGYTGHDEPSLLFYSGTAGSGNDMTYQLTLPKDPPTRQPRTGPAERSTSSSTQRSGSEWQSATTSPPQTQEVARSGRMFSASPTATRTSTTAPTRRSRTTSGCTRARHSWRCRSTRQAGYRSSPVASAATPISGVRHLSSGVSPRTRTPANLSTPGARRSPVSSTPTSRSLPKTAYPRPRPTPSMRQRPPSPPTRPKTSS